MAGKGKESAKKVLLRYARAQCVPSMYFSPEGTLESTEKRIHGIKELPMSTEPI